ncbi:hypothetical protein QKU_1454 [Clostridioides difficile DA00203]|nr:hypothetical protein QKU_1454 [Clostridioides difficile DA00203]
MVEPDITEHLFIVHIMLLAHDLHRELTQGLRLLVIFGPGPLALDGLQLQIQEFCQFAGERVAPLLVAVLHFPDSLKVGHLTDNTGDLVQASPLTAMTAAMSRDDLIALAVLFRADGGRGHNAVFPDRPHQIVHRLIVLHLEWVIP